MVASELPIRISQLYTKTQHKSDGYTYVFEVQLSNKNNGNVVRPNGENRKWKIQDGGLKTSWPSQTWSVLRQLTTDGKERLLESRGKICLGIFLPSPISCIWSLQAAILDFLLPVYFPLKQHCHYSYWIVGRQTHRYSRRNFVAILCTSWDKRIEVLRPRWTPSWIFDFRLHLAISPVVPLEYGSNGMTIIEFGR